MDNTHADDDRILDRIIPDRYADPECVKRYTYYNEFVVYNDHCRLLVRRMDTREVMVMALFDKEKLGDVDAIHWLTGINQYGPVGRDGGRRIPFGRALGLDYNGKAYAMVDKGIYDFRSNRVVPRTDRRFEDVDADTIKLRIRRPSDGEIFHVLFDREDYDAVSSTVWWVEDHINTNQERITIKGRPKGRTTTLDALLLGAPQIGFIKKYSSRRRELDYRKKTLARRVIRNTYSVVSADTVMLTISRPGSEDVRVYIDKKAREQVSAHSWFVRRRGDDRTGRRVFSFVNEEGKTLPELILGALYMDVVPVDKKAVCDCRRRRLLAGRQVNTYTPVGKKAMRLDILHPDGTTRVLLDKQVSERLRGRRWYVKPAGPEGCCEICNSKGELLQTVIFRGAFHRIDRKQWKMSDTIDLRKAALRDHVRGTVYRRLDAHSGELEIPAGKGIVRVRVDHEAVERKKLRPRNWLCEMPDAGRPLRIFCDRHACLMRLLQAKRNLVVFDPEFDQSGRIDCRKQSLARWCPENHYRFVDDKRMELLAPVPSDSTVMRIVLDREDYDRLRRHVWRCYFMKRHQIWSVRNKAKLDIKRFLFFNRFNHFKALNHSSDDRVMDFRKARLLRHAVARLAGSDDTTGRMLSRADLASSLRAYARCRQADVDHCHIERIYIDERYQKMSKGGNYVYFNEIVVGPASAELQIRRMDDHKLVWRTHLDKADWRRVAGVHWLYRQKKRFEGIVGCVEKKEVPLSHFLRKSALPKR